MANMNYVMVKTVGLSGWLLLPLLVSCLMTGYALCGQHGLEKLLNSNLALEIHKVLDIPLIVVLALHGLPAFHVTLRRWGWIGGEQTA